MAARKHPFRLPALPDATPDAAHDATPDYGCRTQMVKDKITLCRQMLPESAGVDKDDALSEVVGFLEACRPRMVDLVEAGMGGALGEDIFANCLQVCQTNPLKLVPYAVRHKYTASFAPTPGPCLASVSLKACGGWRPVVWFHSLLYDMDLGQQGPHTSFCFWNASCCMSYL